MSQRSGLFKEEAVHKSHRVDSRPSATISGPLKVQSYKSMEA